MTASALRSDILNAALKSLTLNHVNNAVKATYYSHEIVESRPVPG